MTAQEFLYEFDLYYNNILSNQSPGLDEYEISLFLTRAQEEIVKNYFTSRVGGNKYQQGIMDSEKRNIDFSTIISTYKNDSIYSENNYDERGKIFNYPQDGEIIAIIAEKFLTGGTEDSLTEYQVIPIRFSEYSRLMSKPSGEPYRKQVWKLLSDSDNLRTFEIVPHYKDASNAINRIIMKYVRKPYPIILKDFSSEGLSIEGKYEPLSGENVCELPEELHKEIIQRAVELAKVFYTGNTSDVIQIGNRTE